MTRQLIYDNLRGISFLLMVIQHCFYFYDVSNNYNTNYASNIFVSLCGLISRVSFIFLAGVSLVLSFKNNKKKFYQKRIKKSLEILLHAFLLTIVTYYYYPQYYIRFGILHFISISTLLLSIFVPYPKIYIILLLFNIFYNPPVFNNFIDIIIGTKSNYSMLDWFNLKTWMPIMIVGMIYGNTVNFNIPIKFLNEKNILTLIGNNTLNLYTSHVIFLIVFYSFIKYIKNKKM